VTSQHHRSFESFLVGQPIPPIAYVLTAEQATRHRFAVDDAVAWGEGIAGPTALGMDASYLLRSQYGGGPALHARQAFRFHAPVQIGSRILVSGAIVEKYERRGKRFIAMETDSRDDRGRLLVSGRYVLAIFSEWAGLGAGRAGPVEQHDGSDQVAPDLELRKMLSLEQIAAYSGPEPNIHTDLSHARAAGLPGIIAQGLMCADWASELIGGQAPGRWQTAGSLSLAFLRAPLPGRVAVVRAWRGGGAGGYDVTCVDDTEGALLAVGQARLPEAD
jgi:acyl dehydratase